MRERVEIETDGQTDRIAQKGNKKVKHIGGDDRSSKAVASYCSKTN